MNPELLNTYFPPKRQQYYVQLILRKGGLTKRRAECFVRLWGYLLLKQQMADGREQVSSLRMLAVPDGFVSCTHREAATLFYADREQGSNRAAGLMIDRLALLGLITKHFDGETLCLSIRALPEMLMPVNEVPIALFADVFNPATDAVLIAQLLVRSYGELAKDPAKVAHKVMKMLRLWGTTYSKCIQVLRRSDTHNPVAVSIFYPTTEACEHHFFESPIKSFFLTTDRLDDPFDMALPGDKTCSALNVRAWTIDPEFFNRENLCLLIAASQTMVCEIRQDFPGLCDIYSMIIDPNHERLRLLMGFERVVQDSQRPYAWAYLAIERYLMIEAENLVQMAEVW
jgi:hypothetical protein